MRPADVIAVAAVCGLGCGLGVWVAVTGLLPAPDDGPARSAVAALVAAWLPRGELTGGGAVARRGGLALAAAVVVALATRWPAGTVMAALAAWSAPTLLRRDRAAAAAVARTEAIAGWAEMLRDTVTAAAGLEQAIGATAPLAPEPIRPQVTELAGRLAAGDRLTAALRVFADEVADPLADLVVVALVHAAGHHARQLGNLLGSLAAAARAQAGMRLRAEAARASLRTSVRLIAGVTAAMAAGLVLLNRGYLAPYSSLTGQIVLLTVGAVFAAGFGWLRRMARHRPPARIIGIRPAQPPGATGIRYAPPAGRGTEG